MPNKNPTRRRTLTIIAGAAGALVAGSALGGLPVRREYTWRGVALGADASLTLCHDDAAQARSAIAACLQEVERLEQEFSLYRAGSALSQLNRDGRLDQPSLDMVTLLSAGRRLSALTAGAFDYTVQPLWRALAEENGLPGSAAAVTALLDRVDYRSVRVMPAAVTLGQGQEITLNGIAQGYITDRVTDILHDRGWRDVLVGLGEVRASGSRADGGPWKIAVGGGQKAPPEIELNTGAIAVSSGAGLYFDRQRRHNHLIDPRTGNSPAGETVIAVRAASAMLADGLSTALGFVPLERWPGILRAAGADEAWYMAAGSPPRHFGAWL